MNRDTLLGLISPRSDEELIGSVMTTFVVDGRFFEEEVLTTLSGLATGSGELGRTVSELHESLLPRPTVSRSSLTRAVSMARATSGSTT